MEASYLWLISVIDSCDQSFQLDCCRKLVSFFRIKYTEDIEFGPYYDALLKKIEAKDALLSV